MYLKINNHEIRFRISQQEAALVADGELVSQHCSFSQDMGLSFAVQTHNTSSKIVYSNNSSMLNLYIQKSKLDRELQSRPTKSGIEFIQKIDGSPVKIALEIDVKKIKPNRSES